MSTPAKPRVNLRSSAVKRILQEQHEFENEEPPLSGHEDVDAQFHAAPLEEDVFEWHVTVRGAKGTDYEGGIYHLRITLPPNYPMSAPDILLLTPSGRFETNKKICIDGLTSFHQGSWRPAWGVRTAIVGLVSFWNQQGEALSGVGALNYTREEKRRLAGISAQWTCPTCQRSNATIIHDHITDLKEKRAKLEALLEHVDSDSITLVDPPQDQTMLTREEKGKGRAGAVDVIPVEEEKTPIITVLAPPPAINRELELAADQGFPDLPLSAFHRLILTPAPRYLPICYTIQYFLLSLFLPIQLRHRLPPRPDRLLLLDALIHFLAIGCTILFLTHLSRQLGFTRLFWKFMHRLSRGLEWILGVQLGFTNRLAENATRGDMSTGAAYIASRRGLSGARAVGEMRGMQTEVLDEMRTMERGGLRRVVDGVAGAGVGAGAPGLRVGRMDDGDMVIGRMEEL